MKNAFFTEGVGFEGARMVMPADLKLPRKRGGEFFQSDIAMKRIEAPKLDHNNNKNPQNPKGLRAINRLLTAYILRYIVNLTEIFNNDIILSIICLTIASANVAHIDQALPSDPQLEDPEDVVPDHMRRPISVLGVAQSLKLPYETTRRYVRKLQSMGVCEAKKGGVIIPSRMLTGMRSEQAMINNANNFHRLVRDLKKLGVALE